MVRTRPIGVSVQHFYDFARYLQLLICIAEVDLDDEVTCVRGGENVLTGVDVVGEGGVSEFFTILYHCCFGNVLVVGFQKSENVK